MAENAGVGHEESQPRCNWRNYDLKKSLTSISSVRLGLEELYSPRVWQASIAELLGTSILVFALDTIVISSYEIETKTPNLIISVFVSIIVTILFLALFPISGGHLNPVITFSAMLVGLVSITRALIYFLAQCLGAVVGALVLKAVVDSSIEEAFSLGGCTLTVIRPSETGPVVFGIDTGPALWIEVICTFILLFSAVSVVFDERRVNGLGLVTVCSIIGIVAGLMVFVSTSVTTKKGYGGVGMNPARCLGPAIVRGGLLWDRHWVFWAGPAIACLAFYLYFTIIQRQPKQGGVSES